MLFVEPWAIGNLMRKKKTGNYFTFLTFWGVFITWFGDYESVIRLNTCVPFLIHKRGCQSGR